MANEQINKIKKEYFVMDEYGYTDKELIDKVNELIDKVNELNALFNTSQKVRNKMKNTAVKKIKGFSSAYPNMCDLKLLPNIDGTWITIQDDVGTSMTVKLSDLSDFIKADVFDKIRAEITDWQNDIHDNEYDAEKHDFVFERIFEIFDENKAESEDKE